MNRKYGLGVFAINIALIACGNSNTDVPANTAGSNSALAGAESATAGSSFGGSSFGGSSDSTSGGSDVTIGGSDGSIGGSDASIGGSDSSLGGSDASIGGSDSTTGGETSSTGGTTASGGTTSAGGANGGTGPTSSNDPACPAAEPAPKTGGMCKMLAKATDRCTYATESCACVASRSGNPVRGAGGMSGMATSGSLVCQAIRMGMGGGTGAGGASGMACRGQPRNGAACTGTETCSLANQHSCTCTAKKWACK